VSVATGFEHSYARAIAELSLPWQAAAAPAPRLLALNEPLAAELGLDPVELRAPDGVALLTGAAEGTVAQAYAGHQFGGFSPRLGDGRALLLGEVLDAGGARRDIHLKGSGRTPFARGGDGKAAVGPMLREYIVSEAMHALGIPTTRALAVVATGENVVRETLLPGAVLARVAASHIRVGTFQFAALQGGDDLVRRLADYAIARHHPEAADADNPYLALLERVVDVQAALIARWMCVGFIHGVMNTDNMTISGETIDYGPCAFMDAFDPGTVFSSIDHGGRYAYGNQPQIAQWNLARLADALLPLLGEGREAAVAAATGAIHAFSSRFDEYAGRGLRAKIGLAAVEADDGALLDDLLEMMLAQGVDFTSAFRALPRDARELFTDLAGFDAWAERWQARLELEGRDRAEITAAMDRVNPVYIPRNHLVEAALAAATDGDLGPFERLVDVLAAPYEERPGLEAYAEPAPDDFGRYQTFCGT
jgi:uncharacterized protein YdiU (UPF0061 family)